MPIQPHVPAELRVQPFRGSEAVSAGLLTPAQLRAGCWRRLLRDVYLWAGSPLDEPQARVAAVRMLLPPGTVLSGTSAAWVLGADVRYDTEPVEVSAPLGGARWDPRLGVRVRRTRLLADDVLDRHGLPVTTPTRTAFDCARRLPSDRAIAVSDALLHLGLTSVEDVLDYARLRPAWPGVRRVAPTLAETEPATESVMETRLRLLLVRAGLPRPVAQFVVRDADGRHVARLDLAYPQFRLGIEYDGRQHRLDDAVIADIRRANRLREQGWTLLRYCADDVLRAGEFVVRQVAGVLGLPLPIPVARASA